MRLVDLRVRQTGGHQPLTRPATVADLIAALKEEGAETVRIYGPLFFERLDDPDFGDVEANGRYLLFRIDDEGEI